METIDHIELKELEIAGNVLYLNRDARFPIQLPPQWDAVELQRLVIEYCTTTEYDCINYVDEEIVRRLVKDAIKSHFDSKPAPDAGNSKTMVEDGDAVVYDLQRLTDIDDRTYAGKLVRVKAVVASNTTSYNVPVILEGTAMQQVSTNAPEPNRSSFLQVKLHDTPTVRAVRN